MSTTIKRSLIASYMNINPTGTASYALIGDGVTSLTINMNPSKTTEQYIHQDSATTILDAYAPSAPVEMTAKEGDSVFEMVDRLRKSRAVGSNAQTDIVNVWKYEAMISGSMYPAEYQSVIISVENFGGDAGKSSKLNYTIDFQGDPTKGHFHLASGTFLAGTPAD